MTKKHKAKKKEKKKHDEQLKNSSLTEAVVGVIESDKFTVYGGLLTTCLGLHRSSHCVFRTRCKHIIVKVNSQYCKWCKRALSTPVHGANFDDVKNRAYLRVVLQVRLSEAAKLSELLSELTRSTTADGESHSLPFTATPPYCTVENVRHISGRALQLLIGFDKEFVWGDNLIFDTKVEDRE